MQKEIAFYSRKEEKEEEKTENHHNNLKVITPSPFSAFAFNAVLKVFRVTLGSSPLKGLGNWRSRIKEQREITEKTKQEVIGSVLQDTEGCRVKGGQRHLISPSVFYSFNLSSS